MAIVPLIPSPHLRVDGGTARQSAAAEARRHADREAALDAETSATPSAFQSMIDRRLATQRKAGGATGPTRRDNDSTDRNQKSSRSPGDAYAPIGGAPPTASPPPNKAPSALEASSTPSRTDGPSAEAPALAPKTARLAEIARALQNNTSPLNAGAAPPADGALPPSQGDPALPPPNLAPPAVGPEGESLEQAAARGATEQAPSDGAATEKPALGAGLSEAIRRLAQNTDMAPRTIAPPHPPAQGQSLADGAAAPPGADALPVADAPPAADGDVESAAWKRLFPGAALSAARPAEGLPSGVMAAHGDGFQEPASPSLPETPLHGTTAPGALPQGQSLRMAAQTYLRQAARGDDSVEPVPAGATSSTGAPSTGLADGLAGAHNRPAAIQNVAAAEPLPPSGTQGTMISTIMDHVRQTLKVYPEKNSATFHVRPAELGPIRIEITMGPDQTMRTVIQAQTAQGQEALQRNAAQLTQEFQRQGLPEPDLHFGRDAHGDGRQGAGDFDHQRRERELSDPGGPAAPRKAPAWNARDPALGARIRGPAQRGASGRINLMV